MGCGTEIFRDGVSAGSVPGQLEPACPQMWRLPIALEQLGEIAQPDIDKWSIERVLNSDGVTRARYPTQLNAPRGDWPVDDGHEGGDVARPLWLGGPGLLGGIQPLQRHEAELVEQPPGGGLIQQTEQAPPPAHYMRHEARGAAEAGAQGKGHLTSEVWTATVDIAGPDFLFFFRRTLLKLLRQGQGPAESVRVGLDVQPRLSCRP